MLLPYNFRTNPFKCAVVECENTFLKYDPQNTVKYHNFPQNVTLRKVWQEVCGLPENFNIDTVKVCSDHFFSHDYDCVYDSGIKKNKSVRKLRSSAIPSRNLKVNTKLDSKNILLPQLNEIKEAVDENQQLKNLLETLHKEKDDLSAKLHICNKKLKKTRNAVLRVRKQYLRKKASNYQKHRNLLAKVFSDSQIGVLLGRSKVIWSNNDLAMAFTLRQMGSRECYLYLKETLNFPLPALSCVQKWAASKPTTNT